jgi:hypothetical protein
MSLPVRMFWSMVLSASSVVASVGLTAAFAYLLAS